MNDETLNMLNEILVNQKIIVDMITNLNDNVNYNDYNEYCDCYQSVQHHH